MAKSSKKSKPGWTAGGSVLKKIAVATGVLATVMAAALYWTGHRRLNPGDESYVVTAGTSLRSFAQELRARGVLSDTYSFLWLARLQGRSRDLKAGEYRFRSGITPLELLEQVTTGRVVEYPLVLIEGWTFKQFMQAVNDAPKLKHSLQGLKTDEIMRVLGYPGVHPEGRFYPNTYYYSLGDSDVALLRQAYKRMEAYLQSAWLQRDPHLPMATPDEALTLASIVEKETGRAEERPLIAGVFVNRLRRGMKLQTDPTVIYGMGERYRGNIRLQDLQRPTPYNTYVHKGLPPTPIAMPGKGAIDATLHPAPTQALYFVSRGDGSHVFSETLQAHNEAVIKYQLGGRRKNFSSHPLQPGGSAVEQATVPMERKAP